MFKYKTLLLLDNLTDQKNVMEIKQKSLLIVYGYTLYMAECQTFMRLSFFFT